MTHLTSTYSAIHSAIRETAGVYELQPYEVRVLLAISDRGGACSSDALRRDLTEDGAATRRALGALYRIKYAEGFGPDQGPRQRGFNTQIKLTPAGAQIARAVIDRFQAAVA